MLKVPTLDSMLCKNLRVDKFTNILAPNHRSLLRYRTIYLYPHYLWPFLFVFFNPKKTTPKAMSMWHMETL